jgi:hypothetical protein
VNSHPASDTSKSLFSFSFFISLEWQLNTLDDGGDEAAHEKTA